MTAQAQAAPAVAWRFSGDMRVTKICATLHRPAPCLPLEPDWTITPAVLALAGGGAVFTITYGCTVRDSTPPHGRRILTVTLALAFLYTAAPAPPTDTQCKAMVAAVLRMAEPHLREIMHNLTLQMGLPPLVIDLGRDTTP